ncbi:hypothetical protein WOLCODRAFT_139659 [Wolfiporia cocos MD-104 SS10]|uniref:Uncharacterized protein n=1 Tax=Wolfiporia cocos (strain MD-104) TaxID=742152 RepID=A0A2H3IYA4_WOLCO|nr:hypothetical protein WOLCODRAFT_139659 [Wolfiporia cocos MD-104 SS10]
MAYQSIALTGWASLTIWARCNRPPQGFLNEQVVSHVEIAQRGWIPDCRLSRTSSEVSNCCSPLACPSSRHQSAMGTPSAAAADHKSQHPWEDVRTGSPSCARQFAVTNFRLSIND